MVGGTFGRLIIWNDCALLNGAPPPPPSHHTFNWGVTTAADGSAVAWHAPLILDVHWLTCWEPSRMRDVIHKLCSRPEQSSGSCYCYERDLLTRAFYYMSKVCMLIRMQDEEAVFVHMVRSCLALADSIFLYLLYLMIPNKFLWNLDRLFKL